MVHYTNKFRAWFNLHKIKKITIIFHYLVYKLILEDECLTRHFDVSGYEHS
jgi:hypothetical protein